MKTFQTEEKSEPHQPHALLRPAGSAGEEAVRKLRRRIEDRLRKDREALFLVARILDIK